MYVREREKTLSTEFYGRYYCKINNSLPFDFLGPPEETYSRLIAIRKFRLVNLRKSPMRSQQPGRSRVLVVGGWLPPGMFIYRVCRLNLTASRRWGLIFYRRFLEFGDWVWPTAKMVMQPSCQQPPQPLPRLGFIESHIPIFTLRFSVWFFPSAAAEVTKRTWNR